MKTKRVLTFALGLALLLASSACTRHDVSTPSPVGPSSFSVLLKLSASPNVILAGGNRAGTTISASLKRFDGTPLADRTVYFEICDSSHNPVYIGYFEGQTSVLSKQTNSGGNVTFVYYGPLETEIEASTSVYIWAKAASEGNEFIEDFARVDISRGSSSLAAVLKLSADPNVIAAGDHRQSTTITASLNRLDGTPLANRTVYFETGDVNHSRVNIGYFEGQTSVLSRQTDAKGNINLIYYGPLESEIEASTSVYIWAKAASEGDEFVENFAQVDIIRGSSLLAAVLKISASPNVIAAGDHRQSSTITVNLNRLDGTPLANRTVYFDIGDASHNRIYIGFFEGKTSVLSKQTNAQGNINLIYYGPLASEIEANTSVYIWAKAASVGDEFVEDFAQVDIIRDSSSLAAVLKLSANPNVISAGTHRHSSTITASLNRLDGTPIANRTVYFDIGDANHSRVNIGYFEGQTSVLSRQTDDKGNINIIYYGPLASEISASTSVYIWGKAALKGDEFIENFTQVDIVRDASSSTVLLDLSANPNILNAGTQRESSTIIATVKRLNGTPLSNRTVYFEINNDADERAHIGYFEGQNPIASRVTDSDGKAYVTYFAPIKNEIGKSCVVHIWAATPGEGDPFIQTFVEVFIIR